MAGLTLPTTLGAAVIPQTPYIRRAATIDTNITDKAALDAADVYNRGQDKIPAALNAIGDSFDKLQLQNDQKEAKDKLNALANDNRLLLYGDGTANNPGYYSLAGDAAVKASPIVKAQLEANRQKYLGQVSNKQAGRLYDGASSALIQNDMDNVLKHGIEQHQVALNATDKATVDTGTNMLIQNPTDATNVANALTMITGSVTSQLDRQGITDPAARQDAIKNATSNALQAAIRTQLLKDPSAGQALYAKFKNGIIGTDQAAVEQDIKQAKAYELAQQDHAMAVADRNKRLNEEAQSNQAFSMLVGGQLTPQWLAANKNMSDNDKRVYLVAIQAQDTKGAKMVLDNTLYANLYHRIWNMPVGSKDAINADTDITKFVGQGLTVDAANQLREQVKARDAGKNANTELMKKQALKTAHDELSGSNELTGIKDPKGEEHYGSFLSKFLQDYDAGKKAGYTDQEMLTKEGAHSLLKSIDGYKRPLADQLKDLIDANTGTDAAQQAQTKLASPETYKNLDELKAAVTNGDVDKETAKKIAIQKGWAQ